MEELLYARSARLLRDDFIMRRNGNIPTAFSSPFPQLLKDNLTLWTSEDPPVDAEGEDAPPEKL